MVTKEMKEIMEKRKEGGIALAKIHASQYDVDIVKPIPDAVKKAISKGKIRYNKPTPESIAEFFTIHRTFWKKQDVPKDEQHSDDKSKDPSPTIVPKSSTSRVSTPDQTDPISTIVPEKEIDESSISRASTPDTTDSSSTVVPEKEFKQSSTPRASTAGHTVPISTMVLEDEIKEESSPPRASFPDQHSDSSGSSTPCDTPKASYVSIAEEGDDKSPIATSAPVPTVDRKGKGKAI
ncbi:hypothetical protein FPQ18DRAFT_394637 [Pyronema domesticum]|uniref:Uncharacterized protein n=1 Tax=Pyronema omphalodes (strain CBS 100304) TaxID=1076935 RepID=U4LPW3_PYROM|nr:hypothetical protein FPQ18DRAFT_394637 [Pyronema domesticum]CCX16705.1 Protein of unknown function [Pyronema omphalodes CBS 100304]